MIIISMERQCFERRMSLIINNCVVLFLIDSIREQMTNTQWLTSGTLKHESVSHEPPHYNTQVTTRRLRTPCAQPSVAVEAFAGSRRGLRHSRLRQECQSFRLFHTLPPSWGSRSSSLHLLSRSSSLRLLLLSLRYVLLLLWRQSSEGTLRYAFATTYLSIKQGGLSINERSKHPLYRGPKRLQTM